MSDTVSYGSVNVGDEIPALTKDPINRVQLALFAGATGDHNSINLDEEQAKAGGLPGVIAHGMLGMGFLGQLLTDWVPNSAIRGLNARFTSMAFPGDVITCRGKITDKKVVDGENIVDLEISAENEKGDKTHVGTASVALPD